MRIRKYSANDRAACIEIFESNCPTYFDPSERIALEKWLHGRDQGKVVYDTSEAEYFYSLEQEGKVLACGGFYIVKNSLSANMAWGMVHNKYHRLGLGRQLFEFRMAEIQMQFPKHSIVLDTSQHTFRFFESFGFSVIKVTKEGYGPGLDRYDMIRNA